MSRRTGGRMRWSITTVGNLSDSLRFACFLLRCVELVEFKDMFTIEVFTHHVLGRFNDKGRQSIIKNRIQIWRSKGLVYKP